MIPCYFDLRLDDADDDSLVFYVSTRYIEFCQALSDDQLANVARRYAGSYLFFSQLRELVEARLLFGDYFGYGQSVVVEERGPVFWRLRAKIPDGIIYDHNVACPSCGGSKLDQEYRLNYGRDYPCNACAGSGVSATKQYGLVHELDDNICLLFKLIMLFGCNCEQTSASDWPMLMFLQLGNGGYAKQGIGGYYTHEFEQYLLGLLAEKTQAGVERAVNERMFKAYNKMHYGQNPARQERQCDFSTSIVLGHGSSEHDASIYLQVPGVNSCSVYSDSLPSVFPPKNTEKVYSLTCHNIDRGEQQLSLLVGLAYLNTLARQALEQKA